MRRCDKITKYKKERGKNMFGEDIIFGTGTFKLGDKRRIIIPKKTGVEKDDILICRYISGNDYFTISAYKKIIECKNKLESILRNSEHNSEIYNKTISELCTIAQQFDGKYEVDGQGRFILPQSICEKLNFVDSSTILNYEGSYEEVYNDFYPCIKVYEKKKIR